MDLIRVQIERAIAIREKAATKSLTDNKMRRGGRGGSGERVSEELLSRTEVIKVFANTIRNVFLPLLC